MPGEQRSQTFPERRIPFPGLGSILPLVPEEGGLVEIGGHVVDVDVVDDTTAEERGTEDRCLGIDRRGPGRHLDLLAVPLRSVHGALRRRWRWCTDHDPSHRVETGECVLPVVEGSPVSPPEVPFHICPVEGGAAEQDGCVSESPPVEFVEVVTHHEGALDEQAAHADGVRTGRFVRLDEFVDTDLDPEVVDPVSVVREDDVDQVLADVVHVAGDGGEHDRPPGGALGVGHVRFEVRHGHLHGFCGTEDEGELHVAGGEQVAHGLHPGEQDVVDDLERPVSGVEAFGEFLLESRRVAVDDPLAESPFDRPCGTLVVRSPFDDRPGESSEQCFERVVAGGSPVVDQVAADLSLFVGDQMQRFDPSGVHDGGVESGVETLMQEYGVQRFASGGIQAERDVRDPEDRGAPGELLLQSPDRLDGVHGVGPQIVVAGRQGEGERVEHEVGRFESVLADGEFVDPPGDPHLPIDVSRLSFLVDEEADDRRPVFDREVEDLPCPGPASGSVLEVERVEDRSAAESLESRFHDRRFGRVEHDRGGDLGAHPGGEACHVGGSVPSDVVDAEVDHVRRLLHLFLTDLHAAVEISFEHGVPERPGAVGVGPFADDEERSVLDDRRRPVDRGEGRNVGGIPFGRRDVPARCDDGRDVFGCRAAATADDAHAELFHETGEVSGQRRRREVVRDLPVDDRRQAGVGDDRNGRAGVLGQVANRPVHLGGSGRTVDPYDVDVHRVEGGEGGVDPGADEHRPGRLDRDLRLDRQIDPRRAHGPARTVDRRLGPEQVVLRLNDEEVDPTVDHPGGLHLVGIAQFPVSDLSERCEFRSRSDRSGNESCPAVPLSVLIGDPPGDPGPGRGQFIGPAGDPVLAERDGEPAERIRLDGVGTDVEERPVQRLDDVGAGHVEHFGAAFEGGTSEVVGRQAGGVERRTGTSVEHDDALRDGFQVTAHRDRLLFWVGRSADRSVRDTGILHHRSKRPESAASGEPASAPHRSGIGTVLCRLPRLRRACPSTALDERFVAPHHMPPCSGRKSPVTRLRRDRPLPRPLPRPGWPPSRR